MKKLMSLLVCFALLFALCACGSAEPEPEPAPEATEEPVVPEEQVYFLSYDTENDAAWQELAAAYTTLTGIPVTVKTLSPETYGSELAAEMETNEPPTVFMCSPVSIDEWAEYSLDLSETEVFRQLRSESYALTTVDGAACAAAMDMEVYGLIVNLTLLESSGHALSEINGLTSLTAVADDIHTRAATLEFDAFAPAALSGDAADKYSVELANLALYYELNATGYAGSPAVISGSYADNYKRIFDLMIKDSGTLAARLSELTAQQSEDEFIQGRAVFIMNGSGFLKTLTGSGFTADSLAMIPLYCGAPGEENAGLCAGSGTYWAVNNTCDEKDIQATLDFMNWAVTSGEGVSMLGEAYGLCPYKSTLSPDNIFETQAVDADNNGKYPVILYTKLIPDSSVWASNVSEALRAYAASPSSTAWKAVTTAMVDSWSTGYAALGG